MLPPRGHRQWRKADTSYDVQPERLHATETPRRHEDSGRAMSLRQDVAIAVSLIAYSYSRRSSSPPEIRHQSSSGTCHRVLIKQPLNVRHRSTRDSMSEVDDEVEMRRSASRNRHEDAGMVCTQRSWLRQVTGGEV